MGKRFRTAEIVLTKKKLKTKGTATWEVKGKKRKRSNSITINVRLNKRFKEDVHLGLRINFDFEKIDKMRKEAKNYTKSIFSNSCDFPYDNDELPRVRFPTRISVPDHLEQEFQSMFPYKEGENQKGKIPLIPSAKLDGKTIALLKWVVHYHWKHVEKMDFLAKVVLHLTPVTLTNLDWLCTNFSKCYDVRYRLDPESPVAFNIHDSYNQRLALHVRAYFDVFARSLRILVEWETKDEEMFNNFCHLKPANLDIKWDTKSARANVGMRKIGDKMMVYLITSVGQLNFFAWAIEHRVIDYCIRNVETINNDYDEKQSKPSSGDKKRRKLSEAPPCPLKLRKIGTLVQCDENNIHCMLSESRK